MKEVKPYVIMSLINIGQVLSLIKKRADKKDGDIEKRILATKEYLEVISKTLELDIETIPSAIEKQ